MIRTDPDRMLALSYADAAVRPALEAMFALDDRLGTILRTTREPIVGQMRLTWWYEALGKLDTSAAPAEPVLVALQDLVLPRGVAGATLAALTDGWDVLLEPTLDAAAIVRFAHDRGRRLFDVAATLLGVADERIGLAGEGWALADLAQGLTEAADRTFAESRAMTALDAALQGRWPVRARTLGAMALSARYDVSDPSPGRSGPRRVGRLAWHRLTGY